MIDFKPDGINDVILLTSERYWVEAFGKFFYYEFEFGIDSEICKIGIFEFTINIFTKG